MEGVAGGLSDASTGSACCGEPNDPSVTSRPCGNDCTHGLLGAAIPRGNIRESVEQFRIFVGLLTASVP